MVFRINSFQVVVIHTALPKVGLHPWKEQRQEEIMRIKGDIVSNEGGGIVHFFSACFPQIS